MNEYYFWYLAKLFVNRIETFIFSSNLFSPFSVSMYIDNKFVMWTLGKNITITDIHCFQLFIQSSILEVRYILILFIVYTGSPSAIDRVTGSDDALPCVQLGREYFRIWIPHGVAAGAHIAHGSVVRVEVARELIGLRVECAVSSTCRILSFEVYGANERFR